MSSILGNEVKRVEDPRLLTEGGTYVEDVDVDAAWAAFVRSTVAHGRITSVEVDDARAAPGVLGVFTGADIDLPPFPNVRPGVPSGSERPLLAHDTVRFVGEAVVAVVADNRYLAADAAELVIVDIEPLPAVLDPHQALEDQILVHPAIGTNVFMRIQSDKRADFGGCEVEVTVEQVNQRLSAVPLEPRSGLAFWTDDDPPRLVHYSACQGAHQTRDVLAHLYDLPVERVRAVVPDMGGGFGAKSRSIGEELTLGWLARAVGRPVRFTETRSENLVAMPHGRGQHQRIRLGGTREGRVTTYQLDVVQDAGAYPMMGAYLPVMTQRMTPGCYDIADCGFTSVAVATNTTSTTAYRGAGRPEATLAVERAIDVYAAEIGMDPAEVRRINLIPRFTEPWTTGIGTVYDVGDYPEALRRVLDAADYDGLRAEQAALRADPDSRRLMGIGLGSYVEITATAVPNEEATVELRPDGTLLARSGATPYGQGHDTTWKMILSDRTGVPMDRIAVIHGDTDEVTSGGLTVGSRSVQIAGSALAAAARELVDEARERAADLLEAGLGDVVLDTGTGRFHVLGSPAVSVDWEVVAAAGSALSGVAEFVAPQPTYPFGAHLAVVDIDSELGEVRVRRMVAVDDAGVLINPLIVDGQVHGGIAQGIAQALYEEIRFDEYGNPLTSNFLDYMIVSAPELPSFELVHQQTPTWVNELGAKGAGESGIVGSIPAVINAVHDALAPLGIGTLDAPLTPEKIWRAIDEAGVAGIA
jgi:carbon-monoxide dehydrogenase large subunit